MTSSSPDVRVDIILDSAWFREIGNWLRIGQPGQRMQPSSELRALLVQIVSPSVQIDYDFRPGGVFRIGKESFCSQKERAALSGAEPTLGDRPLGTASPTTPSTGPDPALMESRYLAQGAGDRWPRTN